MSDGRSWHPRVTVSAVIEKDSCYLMVEEIKAGERVINQPAGHLEDNETLLDAVIRESLEETGWQVTPKHLIGQYQWKHPSKGMTYLRHCFYCTADKAVHDGPMDDDIDRIVWMSADEIRAADNLRSPMVTRCLQDHLDGKAYPLDLFVEVTD